MPPSSDRLLHFSRVDLRDAAVRHAGLAAPPDDLHPSKILLLLYAVECGLKARLLDRRGLHHTRGLDDDDLTHQFDELLKRVGLPPRFGNVTALRPYNEQVSPGELHQVFRYGGALHPDDRARLRRKLDELMAELMEES